MAKKSGQTLAESKHLPPSTLVRSWTSRNNGGIPYPVSVTASPAELKFAEEAGDRFEQAFTLCSFASELVGKASE